ncbi:MAG: heme exporter protein CcmD [Lysobacteraceae bacterium]
MGKYGLYVWSSYGLFVLMLIWDLLWPVEKP